MMNKKELAKQLKEYVDLHIESGPILVTSDSGHQEIYANVGTFLDTIKFEMDNLVKDIIVISIEKVFTIRNVDEDYMDTFIECRFDGINKEVSIKSRVFTDNQIKVLQDKIKYIILNAA